MKVKGESTRQFGGSWTLFMSLEVWRIHIHVPFGLGGPVFGAIASVVIRVVAEVGLPDGLPVGVGDAEQKELKELINFMMG